MINYTVLSAFLCLMLLQTGCDTASDTVANASNSVANATPLALPQSQPITGKPGLPVSLQVARQGVELSVPTRVDLTLLVQKNSGRFRVRLMPEEGLTVIAGELEQQLKANRTGRMPLSLEVQADSPGKYYIGIEVESLEAISGINRRPLAAVIIAGPVATPAMNKPARSPVLPAQQNP